MIESLIGTIAIVALIIVVARQNGRINLLEREIGALRSFVLANPQAAGEASKAVVELGGQAAPDEAAEPVATVEPTAEAEPTETVPEVGPWSAAASVSAEEAKEAAAQPSPAESAVPAAAPNRPDIETALGTRWAVWVGGLALALGGLFLIRYSIEAGIFGPGVRLTMAFLLGLVLVGGGEFIRRTGFKVPVEGAAGAYVPGILTAAGAFTLFGTIYAAHGIYGFIGPAFAFLLLGVIGVGTIAAALVHGQALAGLGLLGSMATPALVSSQSPNAWALFGYLAVVLVANTGIARLRGWTFLAAAGFVGTGLWTLLYLSEAPLPDFTVLMFISLVTLGSLALVWLRSGEGEALDWPTIAPAFFLAVTAALLLAVPQYQAMGGVSYGAVLIFAMLLVAFYRPAALPLLHAAGIATVLVFAQAALTGSFVFRVSGGEVSVDGFAASPFVSVLRPAGIVLAILFLVDGFWSAGRSIGASPARAAAWAGWGALTPLVVLASLWVAFGNLDRDLGYAVAALVLIAIFAVGGEVLARREEPALRGGLAVSFALLGAGVAAMLALHMAFGPLWTTMLAGALAVVPALATRWRLYPVLGWLSVGTVLVVLGRIAFDPTIVGAFALGRTPVFNALLPGYGVPALAFGFAAWQLARTTAGRPRLVMEAAAALLALLTLAMLVRHAMNGGVINTNTPTLAEQAIYTLIALGAGAILVALDMRSPSSVLRIGSLAAGVVSVAFVVAQHFVLLNPLFTDESTGGIPVFNLLFLAYLLPAIAAGALALYARGKRPRWYSAMLGLVMAALVFVYATLSVRRLFQGEHIAWWTGMSQLETYAYSALWLAMGVALLVAGVWQRSQMLRIASAVLIAVAVAKVFIFDMSELEGVLRALSFIGLGAVLIGIGLFYQKLLTRAARQDRAQAA
ncbi:DUF2339 domain-containing protein [Mesorhizobium sp. YM1C-6-2]|uniref:DUF2339 domain-containing protein n=1 Tax=Mesorhizobium sp. YM1C-6-2 TaxID=1827501 RepID=UPI000EF25024|nr:DUF2339 domain-containing protein [Mesorhizobium sp. YM1C-6-2]RLP25383.1 DUF2339 domain-containing protein [Mesorhizobium sp. YM1C-6-2]